jgi:hypothetical protein
MRRRQALLGIACSAALVPALAHAGPPPLTREAFPAIGVSLKVPAGWVESAPTAGLASQHVVGVYHARATTGGYLANLTVIVATVPRRVTLREWLLGSQGARFLSLGTLEPIRVDGVPGLAYTSSKLDSFRGSPVLTSEYGFLRGARGYLFTYTSLLTGKSVAPQMLFRASAATIRFVVADPVAA